MTAVDLPCDFGPRGMAAGLGMTVDEFNQARKRGEIAPPDTVRAMEPRWDAISLAFELRKRLPAGESSRSLHSTAWALTRLVRAEVAEGYHDEELGIGGGR